MYRSGHNEPHSKCGCRATGTWVRIPPPPLFTNPADDAKTPILWDFLFIPSCKIQLSVVKNHTHLCQIHTQITPRLSPFSFEISLCILHKNYQKFCSLFFTRNEGVRGSSLLRSLFKKAYGCGYKNEIEEGSWILPLKARTYSEEVSLSSYSTEIWKSNYYSDCGRRRRLPGRA